MTGVVSIKELARQGRAIVDAIPRQNVKDKCDLRANINAMSCNDLGVLMKVYRCSLNDLVDILWDSEFKTKQPPKQGRAVKIH